MKLTQLAQMTPAQNAWCAAADDAHRHAFILGGEIKVLAGLAPDESFRFAPIIHGIRVRLQDQPASFATPEEAQEAAEILKAKLRADLGAAGVVLPELNLAALGLEDPQDDDETEIEDGQDLALAMMSFGNLELLEVTAHDWKRPVSEDESRVNRGAAISGAAGPKTVRSAPDAGQPERLNPYRGPSR